MTGDWDDEEEAESSCFDPATHKPRVLSAQCATCILRPGNLMHLSPGQLADLMREATREGCQGMICHDTTYSDTITPALCRGWFDAYGARSNFVRVMSRIGGFTEVEPPAGNKEEDTHG